MLHLYAHFRSLPVTFTLTTQSSKYVMKCYRLSTIIEYKLNIEIFNMYKNMWILKIPLVPALYSVKRQKFETFLAISIKYFLTFNTLTFNILSKNSSTRYDPLLNPVLRPTTRKKAKLHENPRNPSRVSLLKTPCPQ